ncbi:MAG: hypothetical protein ACTSXG_01245 [Alphaproteobacteria bacterium]
MDKNITFAEHRKDSLISCEYATPVFIALSFWIFIFSLPPFRAGIWVDSEVTIIALFSISTIIGCASLLQKHVHLSISSLFLLGIVALSLILLPIHPHPKLSFYGLPQTGEGILFYLSFLVLCFGIYNTETFYIKRIILPSAIAASLAVTIITVINHPYYRIEYNPYWLPHVFTAFIAFLGLGILSTYSFFKEKQVIKWSIFAYCIFLILISYNKTAITSGCILSFIFLVPNNFIKRFKFPMIFTVALIPFGVILFEYILAKNFTSIDSRINFLNILYQYFYEHPFNLLVGTGFGKYTDILAAYITKLPLSFYSEGIWSPTWEGIERLDFHSHHQLLEMLLAQGIIGALLYLLWPIMILKNTDIRNFKMVFFFVCLWFFITSMWFLVPLCIPFIALGFSLIDKNSKKQIPLPYFLKSHFLIGFISITLLIGSIMQMCCTFSYPTHIGSLYNHLKKPPPELPGCHETTGIQLANYLNTAAFYAKSPNSFYKKQRLKKILKNAIALKNPPILLIISIIKTLDEIIFATTDDLEKKKLNFLRNKYVKFLLQQAPHRIDLCANHLLSIDNKDALDQIQKYLEKYPSNEIALWLKGLVLFKNQRTNEALPFLKQALLKNVDKFIPIDKDLKKIIEEKAKT